MTKERDMEEILRSKTNKNVRLLDASPKSNNEELLLQVIKCQIKRISDLEDRIAYLEKSLEFELNHIRGTTQ